MFLFTLKIVSFSIELTELHWKCNLKWKRMCAFVYHHNCHNKYTYTDTLLAHLTYTDLHDKRNIDMSTQCVSAQVCIPQTVDIYVYKYIHRVMSIRGKNKGIWKCFTLSKMIHCIWLVLLVHFVIVCWHLEAFWLAH